MAITWLCKSVLGRSGIKFGNMPIWMKIIWLTTLRKCRYSTNSTAAKIKTFVKELSIFPDGDRFRRIFGMGIIRLKIIADQWQLDGLIILYVAMELRTYFSTHYHFWIRCNLVRAAERLYTEDNFKKSQLNFQTYDTSEVSLFCINKNLMISINSKMYLKP